MSEDKKYSLVYCKGVEGNSVYLNDFRIAGPKPWGGGDIIKSWEVPFDYLARAIPELSELQKELEEKNKLLEMAREGLGLLSKHKFWEFHHDTCYKGLVCDPQAECSCGHNESREIIEKVFNHFPQSKEEKGEAR